MGMPAQEQENERKEQGQAEVGSWQLEEIGSWSQAEQGQERKSVLCARRQQSSREKAVTC